MNNDLKDNSEALDEKKNYKEEAKKSSRTFDNIKLKFFNYSLHQQILVLFHIFYLFYIIIIIHVKNIKLSDLNTEITEMTYYSTVGKDFLFNITESIRNIHSLSLDSNMTHLTKGLNFLNIYSRELNRINLTYFDSDSEFTYDWTSINTMNNLYNDFKGLNKKRFYYNIEKSFTTEIFSKFIPKDPSIPNTIKLQGNYNELLFPILFAFIPNLIESTSQNNIALETINIISSSYENKNCFDKTKYLTFPKYSLVQDNFNLIDDIIDPHSSCENFPNNNKTHTNYYNIAEKNFTLSNLQHRKILNVFQKLEDDQRHVNFFSYLSMQKFDHKMNSKRQDILSFVFNFNYNTLENDLKSKILLTHFSIFFFKDNLITLVNNTFSNTQNLNTSLSYNIINSKEIVISIPSYLETLYIYGFNTTKYYKEYQDDEISIINTDDIFSSNSENKILNTKSIKDAKVLNLMAYISNQFMEVRKDKDKICQNYEKSPSHYSLENSEIECLSNLCFFNKCLGTEFFYDSTLFVRGLIKCKCLPLFCGDYLKNKIENAIEKVNSMEKNESLSIEDWNNYHIYSKLNELVKNNHLSLDFFNATRNVKEIKCWIDFSKKTNYIDKTTELMQDVSSVYLLNLKTSDKPFTTEGTYIINYMMNLNELHHVLKKDFYDEVNRLNSLLSLIYFFMIYFSGLVYLRKFYNNLKKFKERIIELNENRIFISINTQEDKNPNKRSKKSNILSQDLLDNGILYHKKS